MREYRLLLNALPDMRRDEDDRTIELTNGSVHVDRYGNRYPVPNRMFPPTEAEQRQSMEPPAKLPAGRPSPDVPLHCPPIPMPTASRANQRRPRLRTLQPNQSRPPRPPKPAQFERNRTKPSKNPPQIQPRTGHPPIPTKIPANMPPTRPSRPSRRPSNGSTGSSNDTTSTETGSKTSPRTTPGTQNAKEPSN